MKSENRDRYSKRNFENLVEYYEKEIMSIHKGESVSETLTKSERGTLLRSGILLRKGSGTRIEWKISKRALDLLSIYKKDAHA